MTRYRAAGREALVAADLPPFIALYHRTSGVTHLLTEPAPEILDALADAPLTLNQLHDALAERFELADAGALQVRLDELVAAGLVAAE